MIRVKNLSISLNGSKILDNINFSIESGQTYALIGPSGCGKSVLMKSIIGLLIPSNGSQVFVDDVCYTNEFLLKRQYLLKRFGMLFQNGALFDSMEVWKNITFKLRSIRNLTKSQAKEIAVEKLKLVGLDEKCLNMLPRELSGGMQKRVAFARTIATDPKILFFDEPTTGLDPIRANSISDLIISEQKRSQATVLIITHDPRCVYKTADKIGMLSDKTIIWEGNEFPKKNSKNVPDLVKNFLNENPS